MHRARKSLGQNFLHDQNILRKIIRTIDPQENDHFLEIGPGRGALTKPLLDRVARLDAIEVDVGLAESLAEELRNSRLGVHAANALHFDFRQLGEGPLRLAGNLPYNISTPLLFRFLEFSELFADIHVMLQKEVVDRMAASPGSKDYGRLTVALASRCRIEALFVVRPGSFSPPPRVHSAFVRLVPDARKHACINNSNHFNKIITAAFSQRRKQLRNGLRGIFTADQLLSLGINPQDRPETLSVENYLCLSNAYTAMHRPQGYSSE